MSRHRLALVAFPLVLAVGSVYAQDYPIMDRIADKVIAKYENATCEQLWAERAQGQQGKQLSPEEQRAVTILQGDPQMQQAFFNKVAAPIVTKMFQCGMIP